MLVCKDPKFSKNLKFYLLLFWPDREEMRKIEGTPEILRIIPLGGLGVTRILFQAYEKCFGVVTDF